MKRDKAHQNIVQTFFTMLPIAYRANRWMFLFNVLLNVIHGVSFGVITLFTQRFFDIATSLSDGTKTIGQAFAALALLGASYVMNLVINGVENFIEESYIEKASGTLRYHINQKLSKVNAVHFESTEFLTTLEKVENGADGLLWFVQTVVLIFSFYPPYFLFMGFFLMSHNLLLVVIIVLVFVPTLFSNFLRVKMFKNMEDKLAPIRREFAYYQSCCTDREYFKETRILGAFTFFFRKMNDVLKASNQLRLKVNVKNNLYELISKLSTSVCYLGIVYLLFYLVLRQSISVGVFAATFASIGTLFDIMEEVIFSYLGHMSEQVGIMYNYPLLMNMEEDVSENITIYRSSSIRFENVSFRYPQSDKAAVKDINLHIKCNETIAIVGENGSGKTTLVRLISGLFKPTSGTIYIGDQKTDHVSPKRLCENVTATIQNYQRYQMTLGDNIAISEPDKDTDIGRIQVAGEQVGVSLTDGIYQQGLDTMLSREFGGIELSGGQWQRIAMARGFYREHELIILDEPTAAIDPIEEAKIYEKFAQITRGKMAIIVTHRLGSIKLADRILMMQDGRIVESGTHAALMNAKGEYEKMYRTQQQWYQ